MAADGAEVLLTSQAYTSTVTFTRPENTTAYTASDVIGIADSGTPANAGSAIHTLASAGPTAGHVMITDATLTINLTAIPSGMTTFRLHLYSASPTAILDNAAMSVAAADRATYLGFVDIPTIKDCGAILHAQATGVNKVVKLAAASTTLYGVLELIGAYTPASATEYAIVIRTLSV